MITFGRAIQVCFKPGPEESTPPTTYSQEKVLETFITSLKGSSHGFPSNPAYPASDSFLSQLAQVDPDVAHDLKAHGPSGVRLSSLFSTQWNGILLLLTGNEADLETGHKAIKEQIAAISAKSQRGETLSAEEIGFIRARKSKRPEQEAAILNQFNNAFHILLTTTPNHAEKRFDIKRADIISNTKQA